MKYHLIVLATLLVIPSLSAAHASTTFGNGNDCGSGHLQLGGGDDCGSGLGR